MSLMRVAFGGSFRVVSQPRWYMQAYYFTALTCKALYLRINRHSTKRISHGPLWHRGHDTRVLNAVLWRHSEAHRTIRTVSLLAGSRAEDR
jgi:hypothetical protein